MITVKSRKRFLGVIAAIASLAVVTAIAYFVLLELTASPDRSSSPRVIGNSQFSAFGLGDACVKHIAPELVRFSKGKGLIEYSYHWTGTFEEYGRCVEAAQASRTSGIPILSITLHRGETIGPDLDAWAIPPICADHLELIPDRRRESFLGRIMAPFIDPRYEYRLVGDEAQWAPCLVIPQLLIEPTDQAIEASDFGRRPSE